MILEPNHVPSRGLRLQYASSARKQLGTTPHRYKGKYFRYCVCYLLSAGCYRVVFLTSVGIPGDLEYMSLWILCSCVHSEFRSIYTW